MFGRFKNPSMITAQRAVWRAAAIGLLSALVACADMRQVASLDPGGVDPNSAIARKAVAASRARPRMPRFSDIPKLPVDILAAPAIKANVGFLIDQRRSLNGRIVSLPPTPSDTDQFAASVSGPLLAKGLTPPPPDQAELTNDFAFVTRAGVQPPEDPAAAADATTPSSQRHDAPPHN